MVKNTSTYIFGSPQSQNSVSSHGKEIYPLVLNKHILAIIITIVQRNC